MSKLLTKIEVADLLHVHPKTVEAWAYEGKLPHVKMGRSVRFTPEDLRDFVAVNRRAGRT